MFYIDTTLNKILEDLRSAQPTVLFLNAESEFMWDQLVKKAEREFELEPIESLNEVFGSRIGLFQPTVKILKWSSGFEKELKDYTKSNSILCNLIVRLTDSDDSDSNDRQIQWLRNHDRTAMVNAFLKWLGSRKATAERSAIELLLDNDFSADEIKNKLDYLALRDDNIVTTAAVQTEIHELEESIFQLHEDLIYARKAQVLKRFDILCEKTPPQQIIASLLTQTRRIMFAMQGKTLGANPETLAEVGEMSVSVARRCMQTVHGSFFKDVNAVLLFNALCGLKFQMIHNIEAMENTARVGLLKYVTDCGYLGK